MDEHHWMTSHGCPLVVGCNSSCWMWPWLSMGLCILFGFESSQLRFVESLQKIIVCANSHHLMNLVNVDG